MRNRAKCRLCGDIIESFHRHDFVECKCKEISIDGGIDYYKAAARNWENFVRIDDSDKEVQVKFVDFAEGAIEVKEEIKLKPLEVLNEIIQELETMNERDLCQPLERADFLIFLLAFRKLWLSKDCEAP